MASLEIRNQIYRVVFRYAGRRYAYSLNTSDQTTAEGFRGGVENTLMLIKQRAIEVPENADIVSFVQAGRPRREGHPDVLPHHVRGAPHALSRHARRKLLHGSDDVVGVTLDGEIGRVLPHELARLALPECEDDVLRRLVERQVLFRDYRATEPVGKGPILIAVDESGSMEGEPVHTAKALALAMAWIARQQRRWALITYSGDTGERLLAQR